MKSAPLIVLCALASTLAVQAADVAWISFHPPNGGPSTAAGNSAFTQAPDIGYTDALSANGHIVTRITTLDNAGLNAATLNAFDLVILSRSVPSGHFQTDAETAFWNGLTVPLMSLSGYINRGGASGNVRMGWMAGDTIPDVTSNPMRLTANNPLHPVFAGIPLTGGLMDNPYSVLASHPTNAATLQRGISVVTGALAGNGALIASVGTVGDPAVNGMVIAEWQAGTVLNTTPNGGVGDVLAGPRMAFLTGSREMAGLTSEGAGIFDLSADGATMFLNAVSYMSTIPEPSTYALLGLGALALAMRRKKS
jgi:hypothetical protein